MHPTDIAVVVCSAFVLVARIPMVIRVLCRNEWSITTPWYVLSLAIPLLVYVTPFWPCIASIDLARRGHTVHSLQVQLTTFGTLSIVDWVRSPHTI